MNYKRCFGKWAVRWCGLPVCVKFYKKQLQVLKNRYIVSVKYKYYGFGTALWEAVCLEACKKDIRRKQEQER